MSLSKKQKKWLSILSIILAIAIVFIAFEYVPKIMGKFFLILFATILVVWTNDFIKHQNNIQN